MSEMGKRIIILLTRQLSPVVRFALIILAATGVTLIVNLSLWWALSGLSTLWSALIIGPVFLASTVAMGALSAYFAWKELEPRGNEVERLETNVQCFEAELEERQRAARAHAAIARLMEAGVRHLADGNYSSRITVELPEPYRAFPSYFNSVAARLEGAANQREGNARICNQIDETANKISEAAQHLQRRAEKLAERVTSDLNTIEKGAEKHPIEAIQLAQYTMGGVRIATDRNIEAAIQLAELGRIVAEHTSQLRAEPELASSEEPGDVLPSTLTEDGAMAFPSTIGTSALKMLPVSN
ncbi:hypothetical protein IOD40_10435 [Aquamicrobium sp. cd-1]|uniref:Methyl-accepting chemotaxis protein n=2 Tax=Aquamicrobium zhengzhouense TaxID=2781738 RepID=A0ABS0SCQ2_9HYPH|nr:hypothetical protein [Aquamicrobium zhengzhouense]